MILGFCFLIHTCNYACFPPPNHKYTTVFFKNIIIQYSYLYIYNSSEICSFTQIKVFKCSLVKKNNCLLCYFLFLSRVRHRMVAIAVTIPEVIGYHLQIAFFIAELSISGFPHHKVSSCQAVRFFFVCFSMSTALERYKAQKWWEVKIAGRRSRQLVQCISFSVSSP